MRWRRELAVCVQATPCVLENGAVLIVDLAGRASVFGADGDEFFTVETGADYLLAGAIAGQSGAAYVGSPTGELLVIEPRGGKQVAYETPRGIMARASFDPFGSLYLPCTDGCVYVFRNRGNAG
jgi:hypothetical protein